MRLILLELEDIANIPREVAVIRTRIPSRLEKIRFMINKIRIVKRVIYW